MTLKNQMATDATSVFLNLDEFAEEITYSPDGGDAKTISAIVQREEIDREAQHDGTQIIHRATAHIATDATAGVASPSLDDTVTLDSATWGIERIEPANADGMVTIHLMRREGVEVSRERHRMER